MEGAIMDFQDLESKLYEDIENEILYSAIEEKVPLYL